MDNFKHKQPNKGPKPIDGFISRTPRAGDAGFQFRRHSSYKPVAPRQDGLRRDNRYFAGEPRRAVDGQATGTANLDRPVDGPMRLELPDQPDKRHSNRRHPYRIALKGFMALFLISIILSGYFFGKGYLKARQIFKGGGSAAALQENVDPSRLSGEGDGRVNILLLGTGGENHDNGSWLTDTIIVASIDPTQKEAALLSIPRDLYIKTEYGSMKMNALYKTARNEYLYKQPKDEIGASNAGFKAVELAVKQTMGIPVHYNAMVDFTGFKKAIDTVGGITIDVKDPVYERMNIDGRMYTLNVKAGPQSFDGFRALAYARSRYTSPRGDFDRSERQRLMLIALKDKILTVGTLANPIKINQLIGDFGDNIHTNLAVNELLRLQEISAQIPASKIQSVSLVDPPNVLIGGSSMGGQAVQIPKAGFNNYKDIHNFVRNKLKDGFLQNENATVAVFNGTDISGLATRTADELKSYGYNVSQIANSPIKNQQKTTVVDLRGQKRYTRSYLEKRFGVTVVNSLPDNRIVPGDADFVIILGQNEQTRLEN